MCNKFGYKLCQLAHSSKLQISSTTRHQTQYTCVSMPEPVHLSQKQVTRLYLTSGLRRSGEAIMINPEGAAHFSIATFRNLIQTASRQHAHNEQIMPGLVDMMTVRNPSPHLWQSLTCAMRRRNSDGTDASGRAPVQTV